MCILYIDGLWEANKEDGKQDEKNGRNGQEKVPGWHNGQCMTHINIYIGTTIYIVHVSEPIYIKYRRGRTRTCTFF